MIITLLLLSAIIIGFCNAVEEQTYTTSDWEKTIFSKYSPTSYWGPRDQTHVRKDHPNKIINFLRHTFLVGTTDVWHGSDTLAKWTGLIAVPILAYNLPTMSILYFAGLLAVMYGSYMSSFHLSFHKILILKKKYN